MSTVKARFDGRVFIAQTPVDLQAGCELMISFVPAASQAPTTLSQLAAIAREFPTNPALPADFAVQHDHYQYGTPKRE